MRVVAWDTWAFVEAAVDGPRRPAVEQLLRQTGYVFTVREVLAETFNFLVRRTGRTEPAWQWWDSLSRSRIRVLEPPLEDLRNFVASHRGDGGLSLTDLALAFAARDEGTSQIATEDAEFRRIGLDPIFSGGSRRRRRSRASPGGRSV